MFDEKTPSQTHPFKRDQPSLCLSCRAGQPQKCVPLQGFRLQTVVVLVVFLYTKIELRRIVTRHVSGNHKACLNGKQSSSSSFQSISFLKLPRMWKSFQKINIFVNILDGQTCIILESQHICVSGLVFVYLGYLCYLFAFAPCNAASKIYVSVFPHVFTKCCI